MPGTSPPVVFKQCIQSTGWQHYVRDCDFAGARYGGQGGDVTARVAAVGDGCEPEDYSAMQPGEIALMLNGGDNCDNYEKVGTAILPGEDWEPGTSRTVPALCLLLWPSSQKSACSCGIHLPPQPAGTA